MTSFRTSALIAGIANALYFCWIGIRYGPAITRQHDLDSLTVIAFGVLTSLPPVATLVVLYWTDASLILSRRGRYVAIVLALFGAAPAVDQIYDLSQMLRLDWINIRSFDGITVAAQIVNWLPKSNALEQAGTVLSIVAQQSIVLFLVALILHDDRNTSPVRSSDLLHDIAMLASITSGIILAVSLGGQVYLAYNYGYYKHLAPAAVGTPWQFAVRNALGIPKAAFPLIFALIVLRSLVSAYDDPQPPAPEAVA